MRLDRHTDGEALIAVAGESLVAREAEHNLIHARRSGAPLVPRGAASDECWWRWGRVELPVQNPQPETTTSVSDGLSSTAQTAIGSLLSGPVACPWIGPGLRLRHAGRSCIPAK